MSGRGHATPPRVARTPKKGPDDAGPFRVLTKDEIVLGQA